MMITRRMDVILPILLLMCCAGMISCDSTGYVYVDEKAFQKQVSHLKDAHVVIVYQVDPTEKTGYEAPGSAWPVIRESRFKKRNTVSDELCHLFLKVINGNQRQAIRGWYPTYEIYVKYTVDYLYLIPSEKYLDFVLDFKNLLLFTSGRAFVLSEEEANLIKAKLDILLEE